MNNEICEEEITSGHCEICDDHELVLKARTHIPDDETLYDVADFYKVFGDSTRIKILYALLTSELCVGALVEILDMTQSAISHQLRVLRQNDLVKYRKEGKTVYYSLDDEHISTVLEHGLNHILHKGGKH